MPKHAYLSASASHRWLACPPSAKLCANIADQTSEYAQQGTDCHELCAYLVEKALGRAVTDPTENLTFYDAEMQNCAEEYRNYVLEQIEAAKEFCKDPQVMIEQRLDFSRWVENGFGTGDCVIVADEVLQIIDYKHGLGVLVSAGDEEHGGNSQMMCYALGALEAFGDIYDINQIKMTIFQPRRDNISTYTISKEKLLKWADEVLAPTAQLMQMHISLMRTVLLHLASWMQTVSLFLRDPKYIPVSTAELPSISTLLTATATRELLAVSIISRSFETVNLLAASPELKMTLLLMKKISLTNQT